jgi:hypothetical protein
MRKPLSRVACAVLVVLALSACQGEPGGDSGRQTPTGAWSQPDPRERGEPPAPNAASPGDLTP